MSEYQNAKVMIFNNSSRCFVGFFNSVKYGRFYLLVSNTYHSDARTGHVLSKLNKQARPTTLRRLSAHLPTLSNNDSDLIPQDTP